MKGFYKRRSDGKLADMPPCGLCKHKSKQTYESPCYNCIDIMDRAFQLMDYDSFNAKVWNRAVRQFTVGMTLLECAEIFALSELEYRASPQWSMIDRLIQRISSPKYERVPGNTNTATFDQIRVMVSLPRYLFPTWNDLRQAVVDNRKEIDRRVLGKIETDYRFKKYGVPLNVLRLSEIVLRNDYALEYIFELKE